MTKADIVEILYERAGFSKKELGQIVDVVFEALKLKLEKGEKIMISSFGKFNVREKKARIGRNPQTGETIEIPPRRVLTFKPSPRLCQIVNDEG